MAKAKAKTKTCFVIAPIGDKDSEARERSDKILKHIIKPVVASAGYRAVRADEIDEPGIITAQVIQHVVEDPMVVADLTGWNPNVFYELALRHTLRKPAVHMIEAGQKIPFDVAGSRTIQVDHQNLDSVEACKEDLSKQIAAVESDPSLVDNPISVSVELQQLRQSDNPLEKSNAEIISMLQDMRATIVELVEPRRTRVHPAMVEDLFALLEHADEALSLSAGERPTKKRTEDAQRMISRCFRIVEALASRSDMPRRLIEEMMLRRRSRHRRSD